MYCNQCGKLTSQDAIYCDSCGTKLDVSTVIQSSGEKRPIAGMVVGGLFGLTGMLWAFAELFMFIYSDPPELDVALHEAFPGLGLTSILSIALGMFGDAAIAIGALLSFFRHPKGNKVSRISAYVMLVTTLMLAAMTYFAVTSESAWQTLDSSMKGGLLGGIIGGAAAGLAVYGLIAFLFRKSRWP